MNEKEYILSKLSELLDDCHEKNHELRKHDEDLYNAIYDLLYKIDEAITED